MPTGSGKSLIISSIAQNLDAPLIVFQPTREILEQNYNKMMDYGIMGVTIYSASMNQKEIGNITLATIGSVYKKPEMFKQFKYIIMDECFVKGTMIDGVPIENIKKNDVIRCYNHDKNEVEFKKVRAISKRKIQSNLIKIKTEDGECFVCTENHPIYTLEYGYIPAYSLPLCIEKPHLFKVKENESQENLALHGLWKRMSSQKSRQEYNLLQPKMCGKCERTEKNENRNYLQLVWQRHCIQRNIKTQWNENRSFLLFKGMFSKGSKKGTKKYSSLQERKRIVFRKDEKKQSHVDAGSQGKNDSKKEGENLFIERGKRNANKTTATFPQGNWITNGISDYYQACKGSISKFTTLLQGRFGIPKTLISYRNRWSNSQIKEVEVFRQKKNRSFEFVRMDSCEVYKRGSGREFKSVWGDGYVYNLEVDGNHNYFVSNYLVHNCHLCNSKVGMYKEFFSTVGEKIIGLTATPYRLSHDGFGGSILKFLTRTNPRVFGKVIHVTQTKYLSEKGYFAKLEYYPIKGFNRAEIKLNSTGADYLEDSERTYYTKHEFNKSVLDVVKRLLKAGKTRILVFTKFVEEARTLAEELGSEAAIVSGDMKAKDRDSVIKGFKNGDIKVVANVGVLTVGFDYPELEVVVMARPTRSLTLYYQMIGRCVRPHPNKKVAWFVDMCGNYEIFGKLEDMNLVEYNDNIWYVMSKGRKLTNVYLGEIMKD